MTFETTTRLFAIVVLASGCSAQRGADDPSTEDYYVSPDEPDRSGSDRTTREEPGVQGPSSPAPDVLIRRNPTSSGPLDGEAAGRVIYENAQQLDRCYSEAGGQRAGRGVVFVLLDVEPEGEVDGVLVGFSDISHSAFIECLEQALGTLTMPTTTGHSVVQTYLVFGARDHEQGRALLRAYRAERDTANGRAQGAVPLTELGRLVQSCYERVFRGRGTTAGRLVLSLRLHEDGRVESVEITEDDLDGQLNECVEITVEKLTLERGEGEGTTLVYPVIVSPGTQGQAEPPAAED